MKLSNDEREFMRLVFEETGGIPFKYVALTELPTVAEALSTKGFIRVQRAGRGTWAVAITGEGSAWAHVQFVHPKRGDDRARQRDHEAEAVPARALACVRAYIIGDIAHLFAA